MANKTVLRKTWDEQKKQLKQKHVYLTHEDFVLEEGKEVEMLERLQLKLGKISGNLQPLLESLPSQGS